jgi:hypothetical protein
MTNRPYLTLQTLERAIRQSWSIETCDPTDVPEWTPSNPSRGQCAVTALVVHDLLGGQLLEAEVDRSDGSRQGYHYWNRLPGFDVDLTREQFASHEIVQDPHLIERQPGIPWLAQQQYELFRARVDSLLQVEIPES